jgi:serine phosphatase RsbU (regulator of sigma subunit)
MDSLDPTIGMTSLLFLGALSWLFALRRLPADDYQPAQPPGRYLSCSDETIPVESVDSFQTDGLRAWARSKASFDANSDFFEIRQRTDNLVTFFLGDVSGKGVPASLYQLSCATLLRQASGISLDPVGVVSEVNRTLASRDTDGRYATLLYGVLELSSGRLRLLSAGHPNPLNVSRNGDVEVLECSPCLPVGIVPGHEYALTEHQLKPGDTLVLYTDGITEARGQDREFFGEHSLRDVARQYASTFPRALVDKIFEKVTDFSAGRPESQTVVALGYSSPRSEFETNKLGATPPSTEKKYGHSMDILGSF